MKAAGFVKGQTQAFGAGPIKVKTPGSVGEHTVPVLDESMSGPLIDQGGDLQSREVVFLCDDLGKGLLDLSPDEFEVLVPRGVAAFPGLIDDPFSLVRPEKAVAFELVFNLDPSGESEFPPRRLGSRSSPGGLAVALSGSSRAPSLSYQMTRSFSSKRGRRRSTRYSVRSIGAGPYKCIGCFIIERRCTGRGDFFILRFRQGLSPLSLSSETSKGLSFLLKSISRAIDD